MSNSVLLSKMRTQLILVARDFLFFFFSFLGPPKREGCSSRTSLGEAPMDVLAIEGREHKQPNALQTQIVQVRMGQWVLPLLIDTGSELTLLKRRYTKDTDGLNFEHIFLPKAVGASGERINI